MLGLIAIKLLPFPGGCATQADYLPGLEAADITALLYDLPIPILDDVPGMTAEEAIEVLFCVYRYIYHFVYHGILLDIYNCIYHGIYHDIYSDIPWYI